MRIIVINKANEKVVTVERLIIGQWVMNYFILIVFKITICI